MKRVLWCCNNVSIWGAPEHIAELVEKVQGEMDFEFSHTLNGETVEGQLFSFKSIIPYKGTWTPGVGLEKWGVGCEAVEVHMDYFHGNSVTYQFQTPWTAPFKVCYALQAHYDDLYISWFYHEPQNEISGYITKYEPEVKQV